MSLQLRQASAPHIELNDGVRAGAGGRDGRRRASAAWSTGALTPGDLLRLPQAITIRERAAGSRCGIGRRARRAVGRRRRCRRSISSKPMRVREGQHLRDRPRHARRRCWRDLIARIAAAAEAGRDALEARLLERARELAGALPIDQAALSQEVVRVAQRSDISEEVTRFHGHLAHWDALSAAPSRAAASSISCCRR